MKSIQEISYCLTRQIALSLSVLLLSLSIFGQVTKFPLTYQLYPRNLATNKAIAEVSGSLKKSQGYTDVRVKLYRNTVLLSTTSYKLVFDRSGTGLYTFKVEITAELANYSISLFSIKKGRETLLKSANNIVAGDAYIIQGQSNAVANSRVSTTTENNADDPSNAPYRNFVRVYGSGSPTYSFTKAWFIGKGNVWYDNDGNVGQWGMRMGSNIAGSKNIPVAIFNGASPGDAIAFFKRNDGNPGDLNTNYGRLLKRIQEAGLQNNIRGLIWYQGESDVLGTLSGTQLSTAQYKTAFTELVNDWKTDFQGLSKFYMFQIRYGCGMSNSDNCLKIQEAQRQIDKESSEVLTISPANTTQLFDGGSINYCHYRFVEGYKKIGDWATPLLLRDLYSETTLPATIESPEPVSAAFSVMGIDGIASQVSLQLKDQASVFTISGDLSTMFRLDGGTYIINNVSLSGNSVLLSFTRGSGTTSNPTSISYRPHDVGASPILTNAGGLALINFEYIPIALPGNNAVIGASNKSIGPVKEIDLSRDPKMMAISTYPNPVSQTMVINYPADQAGNVELAVFDLSGRKLTIKNVSAIAGQNQFRINVSSLNPGVYILQMRNATNTVSRKFMIGQK